MYQTLQMMGWTTYQQVSQISEPSTVSPRVIPSSHISPLWLVKPPTKLTQAILHACTKGTLSTTAELTPISTASSISLPWVTRPYCSFSQSFLGWRVVFPTHFDIYFSNGFETTTWFFWVSKELCNQVFKRICDRFFLRIMKILVVWIKNLLGLQKWLYFKYDWNVFLYGDADQIR